MKSTRDESAERGVGEWIGVGLRDVERLGAG